LVGIEGIDAVGKRTQSSLLSSSLQQGKYQTKTISFPVYDTKIGKEIKAFLTGERNYIPQVRHMLFAANRWERLHDLEQWLGEGKILIVNRYTESNLVYGVANKLSLSWLLKLEEGLPKADLVIVLNARPSAVSSRRKAERKDEFESNDRLQRDVNAIYQDLGSKFGWITIDADRPIQSVHNSIIEQVNRKFSMGITPISLT
jgi:dTMP kinase